MIEDNNRSLTNICTREAMANEYSDLFTYTQLDWLLKTRHKNGLTECGAVLKVSRKLYINKPVFIDWFFSQEAA